MIASLLLLALLAGSLVYCVLTVVAARSYLRQKRPLPDGRGSVVTVQSRDRKGAEAPLSVLRPLMGADEGLEENLRSGFVQQYPVFELLFAVRRGDDAAVPVVEKLCAEFPQVNARLIVTGDPPYANAKVFALASMAAQARHEILVMIDSDVRVPADMLNVLAAEFATGAGVVTCPYRAVSGRSVWSRIEALGMNTEFLGGALVARLVEGMKFALGPALAARQDVLHAIGGFDYLKDFLAEDFVIGHAAAERGYSVVFSSSIIEHRIGSQPFRANMRHRMRWARSTRRSRPSGYTGQIFTNPLPLALLLLMLQPAWWGLLPVTLVFRAAAAWAVADCVLHDPLFHARWWLVPLQDLISFVLWVAGFFGNSIVWRGHRYELLPDGRFRYTSL